MDKLTPEQRDWIMAEFWKLMDTTAELSRGQITNYLREILNALTADCPVCKGTGEVQHRSIYGVGTRLCNACDNTAEDEPTRIRDYDGHIFSIDKLPNPIRNQIALGKIGEMHTKILSESNRMSPVLVSELRGRLQQEESDEGTRTMTPLESQWMDFKKILSELVVFQEDYEERTKDKLPGNKYYSDKLMVIVNHAKQALTAEDKD